MEACFGRHHPITDIGNNSYYRGTGETNIGDDSYPDNVFQFNPNSGHYQVHAGL